MTNNTFFKLWNYNNMFTEEQNGCSFDNQEHNKVHVYFLAWVNFKQTMIYRYWQTSSITGCVNGLLPSNDNVIHPIPYRGETQATLNQAKELFPNLFQRDHKSRGSLEVIENTLRNQIKVESGTSQESGRQVAPATSPYPRNVLA